MEVQKLFEIEPGEWVTRLMPWRGHVLVATDRSVYVIAAEISGDVTELSSYQVRKILNL